MGLTYLPTAQRLSFSVVKATNLKYNKLVDSIDEFSKYLIMVILISNVYRQGNNQYNYTYINIFIGPYIRILQVSSKNGKVIRKKKTSVKSGTSEPEFNETLHFDLQQQQVESMIFIVMVSHRSVPEVRNLKWKKFFIQIKRFLMCM